MIKLLFHYDQWGGIVSSFIVSEERDKKKWIKKAIN